MTELLILAMPCLPCVDNAEREKKYACEVEKSGAILELSTSHLKMTIPTAPSVFLLHVNRTKASVVATASDDAATDDDADADAVQVSWYY